MGGLTLDVTPTMPAAVSAELATVLMLRDPSSFFWSGRSEPSMFRWMATIQPGQREAWAAIGAVLMGRNVDWWSAEWANRAYLEPFLEPFAPIGPNGRLLLAIALGAKEVGERGLAGDVVRMALDDGRLSTPDLAEGLAATRALGLHRPMRWAQSLSDVTAGSDRLVVKIAGAIGQAMPALADSPPAKLVPLLRLLDELLAVSGGQVAGDGRPALEALIRAGGQAGRLSRSILARPSGSV
jgi:hypothetical protein